MKRFFGAVLLFCSAFLTAAEYRVLYLAGAAQAPLARRAFASLKLPEHIRFAMIPDASKPEKLRRAIAEADLVIANGLVAEFREALAEAPNLGQVKIHLLGTEHLAPRIPEKLRRNCVFPMESQVAAYRNHPSEENLRNLVRYLVGKELDANVRAEPPVLRPVRGIVDLESGAIYPTHELYRKVHPEKQGAGRVAILTYAASVTPEFRAALRSVASALEKQELEVVTLFGGETDVIRQLMLDGHGKSRFDLAVAFSFKFKAGLNEELKQALAELDTPVVNALTLYRQTTGEWREAPQGMNNFSVAFAMIAPEVSGLIEPTLLLGREVADGVARAVPLEDNIDRFAKRAAQWVKLRRKANADKRVAIFFYHPEGGKHAIGASYLNVPRSLATIVKALAEAGYRTDGLEKLDGDALTARLLAGVRNVGSWAPGELEELVKAGDCVTLSHEQYRQWFAELPEPFRQSVVREWGPAEQSKLMTLDGKLVIPVLRCGNLAILPEPMRGIAGDFQKLYHSAEVAPPHQYVAVYLWLQNAFRADAVVHLGRHGSQEWLPGKQLGLAGADAPAVLGGSMPSFYPYIADGIGEGIVAKRRGAGVMIAHLAPALGKQAPDPAAQKLSDAIGQLQTADPALREEALRSVRTLAEQGDFLAAAGIAQWSEEAVHDLQHYLEDLREAEVPFGLHPFGEAPAPGEIERMAALTDLRGEEAAAWRKHAAESGRDELGALLHGLSGGFVKPGMAGDPVRTPACLPSGRNFYSFDPDRFPTREAFARAAAVTELLIEDYRKRHEGAYPASTAIVLWAGESVRTGGLNESVFLHLLGMEPDWDAAGRVRSFRPVPAARLGRPRLDAVITTSGAYRDQFAALLGKLDRAQRAAAKLTDVENFLARHNDDSMRKLLAEGHSPEAAARAAANRVYTPRPGTYGVGVNRLAGASGVWEERSELAQVYLARMNYAVSSDGGVAEAEGSLSDRLKETAVVLHSRSSTVYGVTDIDDMYQYLGGLALAVREARGLSPETMILDNRHAARVKVTPLARFIAAELRTRAFHPAWIAALQKEGYAGARTIARTVDNFWGWQAVTPENISESQWRELYEVYRQDRHGLRLREFFRKENAWAEQSIAARMLEAVRKDFWQAPMAVRTDLACDYARSVIEHGVACCDHTCNNPFLHQMVMNLISVPGVMEAEEVARFQLAVERAARKSLAEQLRERRARQSGLRKSPPPRPEASPRDGRDAEVVRGYKMEEVRDERTRMSSSGIRWLSILVLTGVILLFLGGTFRRGE